MFDTLKEFWNYIVDLIFNTLDAIFQPLADAMPEFDYDFSVIVSCTAFVNNWIALDYAFRLFGAYLLICLIVIIIKLTIKLLIPTVG